MVRSEGPRASTALRSEGSEVRPRDPDGENKATHVPPNIGASKKLVSRIRGPPDALACFCHHSFQGSQTEKGQPQGQLLGP